MDASRDLIRDYICIQFNRVCVRRVVPCARERVLESQRLSLWRKKRDTVHQICTIYILKDIAWRVRNYNRSCTSRETPVCHIAMIRARDGIRDANLAWENLVWTRTVPRGWNIRGDLPPSNLRVISDKDGWTREQHFLLRPRISRDVFTRCFQRSFRQSYIFFLLFLFRASLMEELRVHIRTQASVRQIRTYCFICYQNIKMNGVNNLWFCRQVVFF